jgi:hypothetical protein
MQNEAGPGDNLNTTAVTMAMARILRNDAVINGNACCAIQEPETELERRLRRLRGRIGLGTTGRSIMHIKGL